MFLKVGTVDTFKSSSRELYSLMEYKNSVKY